MLTSHCDCSPCWKVSIDEFVQVGISVPPRSGAGHYALNASISLRRDVTQEAPRNQTSGDVQPERRGARGRAGAASVATVSADAARFFGDFTTAFSGAGVARWRAPIWSGPGRPGRLRVAVDGWNLPWAR